MTIRFSAALSSAPVRMTRLEAQRLRAPAMNDNQAAGASDELLHAALRHFAEHGLHAATQARSKAEAAFFAGDRENYQWWLGICRTLDKRLARELARQTEPSCQA